MNTARWLRLLSPLLALLLLLAQPYRDREKLACRWAARARLFGSVVRIGLQFDSSHDDLQRLWSLIELN
jgi:hypothetical protein